MNLDELESQIREDELADAVWMRPVKYARWRGIYPQQVYGWIRQGQIEWKWCDCGNKVISVEAADSKLRAAGKLSPKEEPDYVCPVCEQMDAPTDHDYYDNPQEGDQFHGQYDPEHPEEIDKALAQRFWS